MPPPESSVLPFRMVKADMTTVAVPKSAIVKTRELFPPIARLEAPGPLIVRFFRMESAPLDSVIAPLTLKLIVSPAEALAIASRSEPARYRTYSSQ